MGRVKNTAIKTFANEIVKSHGEKFSNDFEKNKKILDDIKKVKSKRIRNIIAGYISKKVKRTKKTGI